MPKTNLFIKAFTGLLLCIVITACSNKISAADAIMPLNVPTPTRADVQPSPVPFPTSTHLPFSNSTSTPEHENKDLQDYYGGLVITLDYVGQTLAMKPGQGFLLRLGKGFAWTVSIEPADLLTMNRKITPEHDEQGVYIARKKGMALLSAVGVPDCINLNPPCSRPNVLFKLSINIQ